MAATASDPNTTERGSSRPRTFMTASSTSGARQPRPTPRSNAWPGQWILAAEKNLQRGLRVPTDCGFACPPARRRGSNDEQDLAPHAPALGQLLRLTSLGERKA